MKQKFPKLVALFLILAMLMATVAYAAPSPERDDDDDDDDDSPTVETPVTPEVDIGEEDVPLVEVPSVEVSAPVSVKEGQATVKVDTKQIANAVKAIAKGEATRVKVDAKAAPNATSLIVALAKEAIKAVVDGAAEIQVTGSVGQMTLPNAILSSVMAAAGGKDVNVSMKALPVEQGVDLVGGDVDAERVLGGSVTEIDITAGGDSVQWDGDTATVFLPTGSAKFEEGQNYTVHQIEKSGNRNVLSGQCAKVDGKLRVVTSVQSLGTFVVLAGSEGASASADPTAVRSPLFR